MIINKTFNQIVMISVITSHKQKAIYTINNNIC